MLAIIHSIHPCNTTFTAPWFLLYPYNFLSYWFGSHLPFTPQKNLYSATVSLIPYQFTFQPWTHRQQVAVKYLYVYTGCPRRKGQNFGRVFLMLKYTDITQNTYIQSWTVTEIMAREKCGVLAGLRTVPCQLTAFRMSVLDCRVITEIPLTLLRQYSTMADYACHV